MFGMFSRNPPQHHSYYQDEFEDDYYPNHPQYPLNRKQPKRIHTMIRTLFYLLGSMLLGMLILQLL